MLGLKDELWACGCCGWQGTKDELIITEETDEYLCEGCYEDFVAEQEARDSDPYFDSYNGNDN